MEKTIWALLRAGTYPDCIQRQEITAFRDNLLERVAKLNAHGDSLQNPEVYRLQELIKGSSGILSPIRKFPQEILQKIFVLSLPSTTDDIPHSYKDDNARVTLLHVCSSWRQIASSTAEIWTPFCFGDWQSHDFANFWLDKAAKFNHMKVQHHAHSDKKSFDITSVSPYIKELDIDMIASQSPAKALLSHPHYDSLQTLRLNVVGYHSDDGWRATDVLEPLGRAPSLKHLTLVSEGFSFNRPFEEMALTFPWAQLASLDINSIEMNAFPALLSLCHNLQHGTFRMGGHRYRDLQPVAFKDTVFDHLTRLSIIIDEDTFDPGLLCGLEFPKLTELMLEEFDEWSFQVEKQRPWTNPSHFLSQLQNLRTLTFIHPPTHLVALLRNTPLLQEFTLMTHYEIDHVLRSMTINPFNAKRNILPRLTEFRLDSFRELQASAECIIQMATSRMEKKVPTAYSHLRRLQVSVPTQQEDLFREVQQAFDGHSAFQVVSCTDYDWELDLDTNGPEF